MTQRIRNTVGFALLVSWACMITWGAAGAAHANTDACAPASLSEISSAPPTPAILDVKLSENSDRVDVTLDLAGYTAHTDKLRFKVALTRTLAVALEPILAKKQRHNTPDERHEDVIGVQVAYEDIKKLDGNIGKIAVTLPRSEEDDDNEDDETPAVRPEQGARYYVLAAAFYCDFDTRMPDGRLMRSAWGIYADNGVPLTITTSPALHREALQGAFLRISETQALRYIRVADIEANNPQLTIGNQSPISLVNPSPDIMVASSVEEAVEKMRNKTSAVGALLIKRDVAGGGIVCHHLAVVEVDEVAPNNVTVRVRSEGVNEKRDLLLNTTRNLPFRSLVGALLDHYAFKTGVEDPIVGGTKEDLQPWEERNVRLLSGAILLLTAPLLEDYSTPEDLENNVTGGYLYLANALAGEWDDLSKVTEFEALEAILLLQKEINSQSGIRTLHSLSNNGVAARGNDTVKVVFVDGYTRLLLEQEGLGLAPAEKHGGTAIEISAEGGLEIYSWDEEENDLDMLLDCVVSRSIAIRHGSELYGRLFGDDGHGVWVKAKAGTVGDGEEKVLGVAVRPLGLLSQAELRQKEDVQFSHNDTRVTVFSNVRGLVDFSASANTRNPEKLSYGHLMIVGQSRTVLYNDAFRTPDGILTIEKYGEKSPQVVLRDQRTPFVVEAKGVTGYDGVTVRVLEQQGHDGPYLRMFEKKLTAFRIGLANPGKLEASPSAEKPVELATVTDKSELLPSELHNDYQVVVRRSSNAYVQSAGGAQLIPDAENKYSTADDFNDEGKTHLRLDFEQFYEDFLKPGKMLLGVSEGTGTLLSFTVTPRGQDESYLSESAHASGVSFGVYPDESFSVSADEGEVSVSAVLAYPTGGQNHVIDEMVVEWEVEGGATLENETVSVKEGFATATLSVGTTAGKKYTVTGSLTALTIDDIAVDVSEFEATSGEIEVVPGLAADGEVSSATPIPSSVPSDSTTTFPVSVVFRDKHGNTLPANSPVSWRVTDGGLPLETTYTDDEGVASATINVGELAGAKTISANCDDHEVQFNVTAGDILVEILQQPQTLDPIINEDGEVIVRFYDEDGTPASNGTPVRWMITDGKVLSSDNSLNTRVVDGIEYQGCARAFVSSETGYLGNTAIVVAGIPGASGHAKIPYAESDLTREANTFRAIVDHPVLIRDVTEANPADKYPEPSGYHLIEYADGGAVQHPFFCYTAITLIGEPNQVVEVTIEKGQVVLGKRAVTPVESEIIDPADYVEVFGLDENSRIKLNENGRRVIYLTSKGIVDENNQSIYCGVIRIKDTNGNTKYRFNFALASKQYHNVFLDAIKGAFTTDPIGKTQMGAYFGVRIAPVISTVFDGLDLITELIEPTVGYRPRSHLGLSLAVAAFIPVPGVDQLKTIYRRANNPVVKQALGSTIVAMLKVRRAAGKVKKAKIAALTEFFSRRLKALSLMATKGNEAFLTFQRVFRSKKVMTDFIDRIQGLSDVDLVQKTIDVAKNKARFTPKLSDIVADKLNTTLSKITNDDVIAEICADEQAVDAMVDLLGMVAGKRGDKTGVSIENLSAALNSVTSFTSDAASRTDWLKTLAGEIKRGVSFEDITKAVNSVGKGVRSRGKNKLRKALLEAGTKFAQDDEAHHIVPLVFGGEVGDQCRDILTRHGIKLDDVVNGVPLPQAFHRTLNSKAYILRIRNRLTRASAMGKQAVENELNNIAKILRESKLP